MLWTIISWILVGGIAGWIASMIMGKNAQMGLVANILSGVVGAALVGFLVGLFTKKAGASGILGDAFNLWSFIAAIIGACLVIFIASKVMNRGRGTRV